MSEKLIEVVDNAGVVRLTISRPKALNALNSAVLSELEAVLTELEQRRDLRGVLITGAGEKSFVAGADIAEMRDKSRKRPAPSPARRCAPSNAWKPCRCRWSPW